MCYRQYIVLTSSVQSICSLPQQIDSMTCQHPWSKSTWSSFPSPKDPCPLLLPCVSRSVSDQRLPSFQIRNWQWSEREKKKPTNKQSYLKYGYFPWSLFIRYFLNINKFCNSRDNLSCDAEEFPSLLSELVLRSSWSQTGFASAQL